MILKRIFLTLSFLIFMQVLLGITKDWENEKKLINKYCFLNGDWLVLSDIYFFRKQSTFIFIDASLIVVSFLHPTIEKPRFEYSVHPEKSINSNFRINSTKTIRFKKDLLDGTYMLSKIFIWLDQNQSIDTNSRYLLKIENGDSDTVLILRNKLLRNDRKEKKNILICTKIFFNNSQRFGEYRDWIRMNRLFGVDNIQGYKFPGDFEGMLESITLKSVNCIPNLLKSKKTNELSNIDFFYKDPGIWEFYRKMDLINLLLINECYLENMDKYKYVMTVDNFIILNNRNILFTPKENE
ncbi:hypothetical protein BpHYR1_016590 [Brachionus plicatilis]|uniref:Uncharacterized protein n=1 Tax=Brachionus plicatilis TaxID=10195 RepID=A0A3M7SKI6_BRAPC|nr:hypothetical protein BpHYR1_016590 [Brachionus plicatilis]